MVHAGGAPPTKNYLLEAKLIEEWSKKDSSLWLQEFALERDVVPTALYTWRDSSEEFAEALKKAKARLAIRMRQKLHDKENPYNYGLFMREIGFHDVLLNLYEREEKAFEHHLKNPSKDSPNEKQNEYEDKNIKMSHEISQLKQQLLDNGIQPKTGT